MFTKKELIEHLEKGTRMLQSNELKDAFTAIDRKDFVPEDYVEEAYEDYPLPLGSTEQTISQPTTVAFMLELLNPQKGEKILDVGSGSGWTTALLAHLVGESGAVTGVEIIPELVKLGNNNLKKYDFKNAQILKAGKEIELGGEAPFDKILVSAAAEDLPKKLMEQLKVGGTMVIPVYDNLWQVKKTEGGADVKKFERFEFVPLIT
ncbi:MAG: protein-L-isoaspartate O-methyltransferase [Candidatus Pacebacteria bacterium]|jgi:protein-L-isoaspartate(D-aspartate) O-methyltransferase|nr:protein-L-isoaspartate O-methyltransferase [Candidatus Paceibacterota bacterium]MDP7159033.1 protein-L-isoaspartate O-methyltransferase [Candidatus Paceibacterota bacterium]MDP7366632.1 protein-L-isoaspartate O-methyltransferase [Candidatus Paceibacterota bacterium]MDP7466084.1 protein-L-isoaspartate O-methyltransferase [Candidatus Paceibacterota bacterium]MDP7648219.1 protein-L-isoaspartate O-methyltransferase [Candidatus Paceibacterota bacterium]|tara:strand:- start:8132 stop:8749 length:618 start_codon:yes stop_codon:yes gene_type:complete